MLFVYPKFNDLYPPMIFQNFWFILHRLEKVASKLVQKLGRDKRSKKYLQFDVFPPLLPPINIFLDFF